MQRKSYTHLRVSIFSKFALGNFSCDIIGFASETLHLWAWLQIQLQK